MSPHEAYIAAVSSRPGCIWMHTENADAQWSSQALHPRSPHRSGWPPTAAGLWVAAEHRWPSLRTWARRSRKNEYSSKSWNANTWISNKILECRKELENARWRTCCASVGSPQALAPWPPPWLHLLSFDLWTEQHLSRYQASIHPSFWIVPSISNVGNMLSDHQIPTPPKTIEVSCMKALSEARRLTVHNTHIALNSSVAILKTIGGSKHRNGFQSIFGSYAV